MSRSCEFVIYDQGKGTPLPAILTPEGEILVIEGAESLAVEPQPIEDEIGGVWRRDFAKPLRSPVMAAVVFRCSKIVSDRPEVIESTAIEVGINELQA